MAMIFGICTRYVAELCEVREALMVNTPLAGRYH